MSKPLTTQNSYLAISGQLDYYRSGAAGKLINQDQSRKFGDFMIDLSGVASRLQQTSTFTPGKGVKTTPAQATQPAQSSSHQQSGLTALVDAQFAFNLGDAARKAVQQADASAYIAAIPDSVEVHYTPIGAEPQSVEGLGFLPLYASREEQVAFVESQIARARTLADIESQLQKEYGEPVKIAFDPMADGYMMLRPGQAGYEGVTSAAEVYRQVLEDIPKMGLGIKVPS